MAEDTYTPEQTQSYLAGVRKGGAEKQAEVDDLTAKLAAAHQQLTAKNNQPAMQPANQQGSEQTQDAVLGAINQLNQKIDNVVQTQENQAKVAERMQGVEKLFAQSENKDSLLRHAQDIVTSPDYSKLNLDDVAALAQSRAQADTFEGNEPKGDVANDQQTSEKEYSLKEMRNMSDEEFAKVREASHARTKEQADAQLNQD